MTYSQVVTEARYIVGDVSEGTVIHMWQRTVDDNGVATFQAVCGPDDGSGRCMLCWKNGVDADGQLVLNYYCDDIDCLGAKKKPRKMGSQDSGCVLQYSLDGRTFYDVTPDEPQPTEQCFFRCQCCEQAKVKKAPKKSAKKAGKKQKSKGKAKGRKR